MDWQKMDRRHAMRINCPCRIVIYYPQKHTISTYTENISEKGVRVVIEEKIHMGDEVGVEIYLEKHKVSCKGKVVWLDKKESFCRKGLYYFDTGVEFVEIGDKDRQKIIEMVAEIISRRNE